MLPSGGSTEKAYVERLRSLTPHIMPPPQIMELAETANLYIRNTPRHRTGAKRKPRQMRWGKRGAASTEGDGRALQGGGDTPVLTLWYAASEVSTSAERHILHTFS
jgi:hypothetical protein